MYIEGTRVKIDIDSLNRCIGIPGLPINNILYLIKHYPDGIFIVKGSYFELGNAHGSYRMYYIIYIDQDRYDIISDCLISLEEIRDKKLEELGL